MYTCAFCVRHLIEFSKLNTCPGLPQNATLVMRMALGNLQEFDTKKESVEDFYKHFEFFCVANNICGDNADRKKAVFLTLLGQEILLNSRF